MGERYNELTKVCINEKVINEIIGWALKQKPMTELERIYVKKIIKVAAKKKYNYTIIVSDQKLDKRIAQKDEFIIFLAYSFMKSKKPLKITETTFKNLKYAYIL